MDFLNKLIVHESAQHIQLLHDLLMLSLFLFIPFLGLILGGSALSFYYKRKGQSKGNNFYIRFAKDIIETVTVNKSVGIGLGIIPLLTTTLILLQLLHTMTIQTVTYLIAAFVLVCIGLVLLYTFRYTLTFSDIYNSIKDLEPVSDSVHEEIEQFRSGNKKLSSKSAVVGLVILFIALWIIIAALTVIVFSSSLGGKNLLEVLCSWEVLSRFIYIIFASFAFTGATLLFSFFFWDGGKDFQNDDYKEFVRKSSVRITLISALVLPLFLFINLIAIPNVALSNAVFGFSFLTLLLIFWAYHLLYSMIKNTDTKYSGLLFFVMLFSFLAILVKYQFTITNATKLQTAVLSAKYEEYFASIEKANQPVKKAISGEEIYKNICSSCHAFDHKVVGPPYIQTLPGFEGKRNELVSFILSPVPGKVPGYPPMPNPGLNRAQAEAVAAYIMKTYKKYEKK